jgi:C-terminal processing protease CtpA/Prc
VINGFVDDSPAEKSKLKIGDVIMSVGVVAIHTQGDLANASFFAEPGTILEFKVKRDDKEIIVPLKVTIRPKNHKTTGIAINTNVSDSNSTSVADQNTTDVILSPNF